MERLKMNIAKHLKESSSQRSPKKRFFYGTKHISVVIPTLLLASLIGTYLDLYFVGKGIYYFPKRPLPEIFPINIFFTLIGLPLFVGLYIYVCQKVNVWKKAALILLLSLFISIGEKQAETWGLFIHNDSWKHIYSFIGYALYLTFIYVFYRWVKRIRD
ncbi:CBO0543 family protein [Peribacillus asahii]|uniref:CBO0543 family protein n=1 Tax=Peribacillus asahii TaxID=228899 RepID=UPI0027D7AFA9|nr:CBO0543 family protein [Peribacillus asahii]